MDPKSTPNGPLSGVWYDAIYGQEDNALVIEKCDRYECYHDPLRDTIWGNITRLYPADQRGKRWEYMGYVHGSGIDMCFRSTDLVNNPGSYGIIILLKADESHYQGYYYRPLAQMSNTGEFITSINAYRIDWRRTLPPNLQIPPLAPEERRG